MDLAGGTVLLVDEPGMSCVEMTVEGIALLRLM